MPHLLPKMQFMQRLLIFNIASHKVLQKTGFEREAILKQAAVKNGKSLMSIITAYS